MPCDLLPAHALISVSFSFSEMSSATLETWFVCRRPKPDASIRLFCAAWAGGSATSFNKWPARLPEAVELHALQLPGRMSRSKEECLTSVPAIVGKAAEALIAMGLLDKPFALFGHSFGSLVMFELARRLADVFGKTPSCLIVSGCRPPDICAVSGPSIPISQLQRDDLVNHLVELGGMPAELRDQTELVDFFLPSIRADYTAFECYRYRPSIERDNCPPPLACPVVCLGGDADTGALPSDLEHWASFTTGEFRLETFEGGHFFLKGGQEPAVLEFLGGVLVPH